MARDTSRRLKSLWEAARPASAGSSAAGHPIGILVCPVGAAFTIAALVLVAAVDIMRPLTATSFGRTIGDEGKR